MNQVKPKYYVWEIQMKSAIKPAQFRGARRIWFWRAMAIMFTVAAFLFLLLASGLLDFVAMI